MSSFALLLILLVIFYFSFYGRKTILGFWGSLFLLLFLSLFLSQVLGPFSVLPGAAIILFMGSRK